MKRLPPAQVKTAAAELIRYMICRHGERNLEELTLEIRRQARERKPVKI